MKTILKITVGLVLAVIYSCTSTSKIKSVTKTTEESKSTVKVDSNVIKGKDSTKVVKGNSFMIVESTNDYEKETVIEFDTAKAWQEGYDSAKSFIDAADYFPVTQRVTKITIKEKGKLIARESVQAKTVDSVSVKSQEQAEVKKEEVKSEKKTEFKKDKQVKRISYWWWLLLLIIPIIYRKKIINWLKAFFTI